MNAVRTVETCFNLRNGVFFQLELSAQNSPNSNGAQKDQLNARHLLDGSKMQWKVKNAKEIDCQNVAQCCSKNLQKGSF